MADMQHGTMVVNIPITVAIPLEVIARIKNEECHPAAALNWVLTDVVNDITSAVKAIPYDIIPTRERANTPSTISLSPTLTPPPDEIMTLNIIGVTTGRGFDLSVRKIYSVAKVKERIEEHNGISPAQQRLIWRGKQMNDEKTLGEVSVP